MYKLFATSNALGPYPQSSKSKMRSLPPWLRRFWSLKSPCSSWSSSVGRPKFITERAGTSGMSHRGSLSRVSWSVASSTPIRWASEARLWSTYSPSMNSNNVPSIVLSPSCTSDTYPPNLGKGAETRGSTADRSATAVIWCARMSAFAFWMSRNFATQRPPSSSTASRTMDWNPPLRGRWMSVPRNVESCIAISPVCRASAGSNCYSLRISASQPFVIMALIQPVDTSQSDRTQIVGGMFIESNQSLIR